MLSSDFVFTLSGHHAGCASSLGRSHFPIHTVGAQEPEQALVSTSTPKASDNLDDGKHSVVADMVMALWQDADRPMSSLWSLFDKRADFTDSLGTVRTNLTASDAPTNASVDATSQSSPSAIASSTLMSSASEAPTAATPQATQVSTRLSQGLKIGLGLGIPSVCIVISITTVAAFILRRKKRKARSAKEETNPTVELEGQDTPGEMDITWWEMIHRDDGAELENNWRREIGGEVGVELAA